MGAVDGNAGNLERKLPWTFVLTLLFRPMFVAEKRERERRRRGGTMSYKTLL